MSDSGPILVVDDDDDIRDMLSLLIEGEGYRVVTAGNGVDAWQCLSGSKLPALILLDLMMPSMDGERFLETLRNSQYGRVPVVVLSGHNAAKEKAAGLHADGFLAKPVELQELFHEIQRLAPDAARVAADGQGGGAPAHGEATP